MSRIDEIADLIDVGLRSVGCTTTVHRDEGAVTLGVIVLELLPDGFEIVEISGGEARSLSEFPFEAIEAAASAAVLALLTRRVSAAIEGRRGVASNAS